VVHPDRKLTGPKKTEEKKKMMKKKKTDPYCLMVAEFVTGSMYLDMYRSVIWTLRSRDF